MKTEQRQRVGRVQAYLGRCSVEEVRRRRAQFGAVTVQGPSGLKVMAHLHRAGDLDRVDLDPAVYRAAPSAPFLDATLPGFEKTSFDWISAQINLGLRTVRTAGPRIRVGRIADVRAELDRPYPVHVTVVLALDKGWLGPRHIDSLIKELTAADRDVSFVFADSFDPLDSATAIAGLRKLLRWASTSRRNLELLRTDLIALPAVLEGAVIGAIGLGTSTRHLGLPLPPKLLEEYRKRQTSPLVFVPRLLHWQRGHRLGGLSPWRGAGVTNCDCSVCYEAGADLLRFDTTYKTIPASVLEDVRNHDAAVIGKIVRDVLDAHDPIVELDRLRANALHLARFVASSLKVHLDLPPAWFNSWHY